MGGAGDPPAPVGDPPTGTAASNVAKRRSPLARTVARGPSGESPDGTGGSPVLPANHFSNTLSAEGENGYRSGRGWLNVQTLCIVLRRRRQMHGRGHGLDLHAGLVIEARLE